jgi:four helix bundle protein
MSDYRDLRVYTLARETNKHVIPWITNTKLIHSMNDQFTRATLSITLNIAEGSARKTSKDQRRFYVIARSSATECQALLDAIEDLVPDSLDFVCKARPKYESISKMLFRLIEKMDENVSF